MAMSEAHKEAIRRGVRKYHSDCRKAMNKPSKKPKKPAPPVKTKPITKKPSSKKTKSPEIFFDTIPSPPPKKKLTEAEILKLEARDKPKAKPVKKVKKVRKKK
jgi:hypothetical protein